MVSFNHIYIYDEAVMEMQSCTLTAEGRMPPRAVYRASLPIGIPIPCHKHAWSMHICQKIFSCRNDTKEGNTILRTAQVRSTTKYSGKINSCNYMSGKENKQYFVTHTCNPRSPSPRIRSPSVTTMTCTFGSGQFLMQSNTWPLHMSHAIHM